MSINLILPDEIITSAQREKVDKMMKELVILTTTVGCIFERRQQIVLGFNRNVLFDDIKEMISAKIVRPCGRMIKKFFYKFPVLTDLIKFTEIELIDNEDVETMVALYRGNRSDQNALIQLFAKLAGVEQTEDPTPLGEEHGAQEPCMVVLISTLFNGRKGEKMKGARSVSNER
ncbi:hypothetical protein GOBAR_DD12038 [Gossypium barbadense]|nr:hypothetical protein GOBAR_DD12038 [Gossypium barbadense]